MAENFFGITDTGKHRSNNEDAFIAQKSAANNYVIAAVIDGVGGYAGGEVAAAIARETIIDTLSVAKNDFPDILREALYKANEKINDERTKAKEHNSMACVCTLAVADVDQNTFYYAHVGDTRLYLLRDGSLVKISTDHSFVGFLEDSGRLTEEAAMSHPKRNEINKALGFEPDIRNNPDYIEIGNSPFLPGDTLLLCSDGLTDMVKRQDIADILASSDALKVKGYNLINLANHNGGHDNITVVLVRNDKKAAQRQAVLPATDQKKKIITETEPVKETPVPIKETSVSDEEKAKVTRSSGATPFLGILCVVLALSTGWFYWQYNKAKQTPVKGVADVDIVKHRPLDPQEQKLMAAIAGVKKDTLQLADSSYKSPVTIDSTITITRDTLYIWASGNIVLKADSGFKGPAFKLAANCKHVVFDHVNLDGFSTAITSATSALQLKSVKFNHCAVPVVLSYAAPDGKTVSGTSAPNLFKPDSLPKAMKK